MGLRLVLVIVLAAGTLLAQEPFAGERELEIPEKNPFDTPADAEAGRRYFLGHCAQCHGSEGEGGRGVNLTTGQYRHGGSDRELYKTIKIGIRGTEMPGARLSEPEVWRIVTYVRRIGAAGAEEKAPGDPAAGKVIYESKGGCVQCHMIGGAGGILGPDLTEIGLRRSVKFLRESLTSPEAHVADDYRTVVVVTGGGERITGILLNEDDYSIQLRDTKENMRSYWKSSLKEVRREKSSLMPPYGSALTSSEIDNVVAYMNSLRGKP